MALTFNTTLTTDTGLQVADAYGRVSVADSLAGTTVQAYVDIFVSEDAYLAGARPIKTALQVGTDTPYNRDVDGTDILDIAHDTLVAFLAKQGVSAVKSL